MSGGEGVRVIYNWVLPSRVKVNQFHIPYSNKVSIIICVSSMIIWLFLLVSSICKSICGPYPVPYFMINRSDDIGYKEKSGEKMFESISVTAKWFPSLDM